MTPAKAPSILEVRDLQAWYGESKVLYGMNFSVNKGEIATLIGRNGAGKTSTLRSIMGLVGKRTGHLYFEGHDIVTYSPDEVARKGVAYCPEERGIFASLSVHENLLLPPIIKPGGMSIDAIHQLFPNLLERRNSQGTKLSGGEQQMLAIARILRTGAHFLLLDEPTEGLAPVIVQQIAFAIQQLKKLGFTVLLVEQNFNFASQISDHFYVVEQGAVVDQFSRKDIEDPKVLDQIDKYLSV